LQLELALKFDLGLKEDDEEDAVEKNLFEDEFYRCFFQDERFLKLLAKYDISIPVGFIESINSKKPN